MSDQDDQLIERLGSILDSRERLRDRVSDEPAAMDCSICGDTLTTEGELAFHNMVHSATGRLVAYAIHLRMAVSFCTPEELESKMAVFNSRGRVNAVQLEAIKVDYRSNQPRAICVDCGSFVYLGGRGVFKHNDSTLDEDHQARTYTYEWTHS